MSLVQRIKQHKIKKRKAELLGLYMLLGNIFFACLIIYWIVEAW